MFLRSSVHLHAYVAGSDHNLKGPPVRESPGQLCNSALVWKQGSDIAAPGSAFSLEHVRFNLAAQRQNACRANLHDQSLKASVSWNSVFIQFRAHSNPPRGRLILDVFFVELRRHNGAGCVIGARAGQSFQSSQKRHPWKKDRQYRSPPPGPGLG